MSRPRIYLDFETRSEVDITTGGKRYAEDSSTDIVMLSWSVNDLPEQLWLPPDPPPGPLVQAVKEGALIYAFNATFDMRIWNCIGVPRYGLPSWILQNTVDVMALCGRYTLPQKLAMVGKALNLPIQKNPRGTFLIKKICCPPFQYTPDEFAEFMSYCIDDVRTMKVLISTLPADHLSDQEQKIWEMTYFLNQTGVPVDSLATTCIRSVTSQYFATVTESLPDITNGLVSTPGQIARIRNFLAGEGVHTDNLQAETVEKLLKDETLTPAARAVLEIRSELGQSSVKKYSTLEALTYNGRIYDNFVYYGQHTGRWSGRGFQLHNLPRAQEKNVDEAIKWMIDPLTMPEETNPMTVAKGLVRAMILAPERFTLFDSDYSSIENILLAWCAEDWVTIEGFESGFCQYSDMAAFLYKVQYDDIVAGHKAKDKEMSHLRQVGKVVILGCGYAMASKTLVATADGYGIKMTEAEAESAVSAYRAKYKKVVQFWYRMMNMARAAIRNKGTSYTSNGITFTCVLDRNSTEWLVMELPSKRKMMYMSPQVEDTLITHMGVNPYSKNWNRLKMIPGRLTENIIQATARDVLAHGKLTLMESGFKVIASIHDQIVAEVPEEEATPERFEEFKRLMCQLPEWAKTPRPIPLKAGGYVGKRFRKD